MEAALTESTIIRFQEQMDICKKEKAKATIEKSEIESDINDEQNDIHNLEITLLLDEYISLEKALTNSLNNLATSGDAHKIRLAQEKIPLRKERAAKVMKLLRDLMYPANEFSNN